MTLFHSRTLADAKAKEIALEITTAVSTEIDKVKAVHDWIILNTAYDVEALEKKEAGIPFRPDSAHKEGIFNQGLAICTGYSEAAQAMLNSIGIETLLISNHDHQWNLVHVGGKWYHMDVTWDDPIPDVPGRVVYDYFLLSNETIATSRPFTPLRPANDDYLASVKKWNGLPVIHRLEEIPAVLQSSTPGTNNIQLYLWRLDAEQAFRTAVRSLPSPGSASLPSYLNNLMTHLLNLDFRGACKASLPTLGGDAADWRGSWTTSRQLTHLQITSGEPEVVAKPTTGIMRPWLRLRCGGESCSLFAKDPSSLRLDQGRIRSCFKIPQDPEGNPVYRYFSPDVPTLEFSFDLARGWLLRVPPGAANGFVLKDLHGRSVTINDTFMPVPQGSQLTLFSKKKRRAIDSATFIVSND